MNLAFYNAAKQVIDLINHSENECLQKTELLRHLAQEVDTQQLLEFLEKYDFIEPEYEGDDMYVLTSSCYEYFEINDHKGELDAAIYLEYEVDLFPEIENEDYDGYVLDGELNQGKNSAYLILFCLGLLAILIFNMNRQTKPFSKHDTLPELPEKWKVQVDSLSKYHGIENSCDTIILIEPNELNSFKP